MGYLDDREPNVRRGAMIGLLQHGGIEGVLAAGQKLMNMTVSADPAERVLAAQILGEVGLRSFYQPLLPLLKDSDPVVKSAAIQAVGKIKHSKLWPPVIEALTDIRLRPVATRALIAGGESALPEIQLTFEKAGQPREVLGKLVHVCSRIKTERVINLLEDKIGFPDPAIRTQILTALCAAQYRAPGPDTTLIQRQIKTEVEEAAQSFALLTALDERPEAALLVAALKVAQKSIQERLFFLLSFLYDGRALQQVQNALKQETGPHRSYALEILDTMLAPDIKNYMLALLEELTPAQRLQKLKGVFSQPPATLEEQLRAVCAGESLGQDYWVRSCAIYAAGQLAFDALAGTINSALTAPEPAVRETAQLALSRLNTIAYTAVGDSLSFSSPRNFLPEMEQKGTPQMYSTIEKVIILKTVNIFAETPDEALVEVAGILEEVEVSAGEQIIEKDELGDTMYIIVNGKVRVHNGEVELNILKERDIFGEMAVLDAEPRSASVTALEDCLLFRLNQDSFYELMADRIEITRGIVRVLSGHVRARVRDVMELRAQLHEKELAANQ
jgi:HEAT repeat protein